MSEQLCLRLDQSAGAAVANGKEAAEFIDRFVGVEADRAGVIADEGAREDTRRPPRKVVALEPLLQVAANLGDRGYGID